MNKLIFITLLSLASARAAIGDATITAEILGVKSKPASTIICALFSGEIGYPMDSSHALKTVDGVSNNGTAECVFRDIPKGRYAISVLHDEDGNRKMRTNLFGVPQEGWATSNNVSYTLRAPNFWESNFALDGRDLRLQLEMHY